MMSKFSIRTAILSSIIFMVPAAISTDAEDRLPGPKARVADSLVFAATGLYCPDAGQQDTVILRFIGDVMMHKAQIAGAEREDGSYDFSGYFEGIREDLEGADVAVANMEFALAGPPYTGYPAFSAPDSYAEYMAECGVDVFLTANNHILDKGEAGLLRTLEVYRSLEEKYGTKMTGSGADRDSFAAHNPLIMNVKGLKLAFVNFTYGTNLSFGKEYPGTFRSAKNSILEALERAQRLGADFIIALPHWGEEYKCAHSPEQEALARWLVDMGADIVVGTHPHVVQDVGKVDDVWVVYSLGNAISNMSAPNTQIGLMLELRLPVEGGVWSRGVRVGFAQMGSAELGFDFLWSSLPGRLSEGHCTVKVSDYSGRREDWIQEYEYDKMMSTYFRVKELTGIDDGL